jgi:hypothetical protein
MVRTSPALESNRNGKAHPRPAGMSSTVNAGSSAGGAAKDGCATVSESAANNDADATNRLVLLIMTFPDLYRRFACFGGLYRKFACFGGTNTREEFVAVTATLGLRKLGPVWAPLTLVLRKGRRWFELVRL